ncbi:MAG: DNA internalization-related competence protein ComEC/Rec2 [Rhodocyclaceae bacterium]|nr:DNA internalization-related competence protein ComEC/Rec2 [Rhodocyclaceae bacterium]
MPTVPALLVLAATLQTQLQATLPPAWLVAVAAALAGVALAVAGRTPGAARAACLLLALVAGTWALASARAQARLDDALPAAWIGHDIEVVGRVVGLPRDDGRSLRVEWVTEQVLTPGARVPERLLLSRWSGPPPRRGALEGGAPSRQAVLGHSDASRPASPIDALPALAAAMPMADALQRPSAPPTLAAGERWQLTVRLKPPQGLHNFHGFDYEAWLFAQGIRATGSIRAAKRLGESWHLDARLAALREAVRARMLAVLGDHPQAGVLVALAIGDGAGIGQDQWQRYRDTGVMHLMSISGLHVTLFAGIAAWLAARFWRRCPPLMVWLSRRRFASLAAGVCGIVYVALAGWGLPAQRTLYMILAMAWAAWRGERWFGARPLATALVVVCWLDPWGVLQIGFWLSFGAVAVLVFCGSGRLRQAVGWREAVGSQWAMTLSLMPATLFLFQQTSWVAPLANALAIPVVSLAITPLALFGAFPGLGWLLPPAAWLMDLLDRFLVLLLELPQPMVDTAAPAFLVALLAFAGALLVLLPAAWPRRWLGLCAFLPLFLLAPARPGEGEMHLTVFDVGQGQSLLLQTRTHDLLFDAGPASAGSDAGERVVVPQLRAMGVRRLDTFVVSHNDTDHRGGAHSVLAALPITQLLHTDREGLIGVPAGVRSGFCDAGAAWVADGVRFDILHPALEDLDSALGDNEVSCTLRVSSAAGSVFIPGDLEKLGEAALLARAANYGIDLRSDVILVPHHGSRHASGEALVDAVDAGIAVYPVGAGNRYGHPAPAILDRYAATGADQWRTDCDGAVRLELSRDGEWRVTSSRVAAPRYWQRVAECSDTPAQPPGRRRIAPTGGP